MDLRVLSVNQGDRLSWTRAVLRNLLKPLDLVLGVILIPTSERRQSLGDRAARSVVLVAAAGPSPKGEGELTGDNVPVASIPPPGAADQPLSSSPAIGASWGPIQVLLGFLALLIGTALLSALIAGTIDSDLDSTAATLALQAAFAIAMAGSAYLGTNVSGGFAAMGRALGLGPSLRSPFAPAAIAYGCYIAVAIAISLLLSPEQEDVTRELGFGEGIGVDLAAFFLIVVAAPVTEEIFFRGFFFAGVRAKTGFWIAAVISSGIWGLFHFTGSDSWPVVLQLSIFGVILCWLYERTGSIRPTIAVHAINNAIAFAVLTSG
jgi:membrane protease YdiL (CAAX protease family)